MAKGTSPMQVEYSTKIKRFGANLSISSTAGLALVEVNKKYAVAEQ